MRKAPACTGVLSTCWWLTAGRRGRAPEVLLELGEAERRAGDVQAAQETFARPRRRPAARRGRAARPRRARACGPGLRLRQHDDVRSRCSSRRSKPSATRRLRSAPRCSRASRWPSTSSATASAAMRSARRRSRWRGGSATERRSPTPSTADTGRCGDRATWTSGLGYRGRDRSSRDGGGGPRPRRARPASPDRRPPRAGRRARGVSGHGTQAARLADELRQPLFQWYRGIYQTMRALFEGRFDEADRLSRRRSPWPAREPDAMETFGVPVVHGCPASADSSRSWRPAWPPSSSSSRRFRMARRARLHLGPISAGGRGATRARDARRRGLDPGSRGSGVAGVDEHARRDLRRGRGCNARGRPPSRAPPVCGAERDRRCRCPVPGVRLALPRAPGRHPIVLEDAARHFEVALEANAKMGARRGWRTPSSGTRACSSPGVRRVIRRAPSGSSIEPWKRRASSG